MPATCYGCALRTCGLPLRASTPKSAGSSCCRTRSRSASIESSGFAAMVCFKTAGLLRDQLLGELHNLPERSCGMSSWSTDERVAWLQLVGCVKRPRQKKHRFSFTRNTPLAIELSQCLLRSWSRSCRATLRREEFRIGARFRCRMIMK
jgi:hypothetical protein